MLNQITNWQHLSHFKELQQPLVLSAQSPEPENHLGCERVREASNMAQEFIGLIQESGHQALAL